MKPIVYHLEDTDQDASVPILIEIIKDDPSMDVRKAAIRTLGEIGTPEARNALMEILNINE